MDEMRFVYTLTDNGRVFYVGCTKDIHKRYLQHCGTNVLSETYRYIQNVMIEGRMPQIHIIHYLPANEAHFKEAALICLFIGCGQTLCNGTFTDYRSRIKIERNPFTITRHKLLNVK